MSSLVKLMGYGFSGAGKTTLLGTVASDPRVSPALMLDFEAGTLSIASKVREIPNELEQTDGLERFVAHAQEAKIGKIDVLRVKAWEDMDDVFKLLDRGDLPYKALLGDSLTEINYLNLRNAIKVNFKKGVKGSDGEMAYMSDYGRSATQMRQAIRQFRDLPLHIFFACLAQDTKDDLTGEREIRPSLIGKLSEEIPAFLDIMGYIEPERGSSKRIMHFQPQKRFRAKDRSEGGRLGEFIEEPTIPKILDLLGIEMPPATQVVEPAKTKSK